jgi:hypothetical protein
MAGRSILISPNPVTQWGPKVVYSVRSAGVYHNAKTLTYDHYDSEDAAKGRFGPISFTLHGPQTVLKEMAENGLGRQVQVWGYGLEVEFEGMVWEMGLVLDEDRLDTGLDTMVNKAKMRADYDGDGDPERSTDISNEDSQERFGTKEEILLGGELSSLSVADQAVQTWINRKGFPLPEPRLGSGDAPGIAYLVMFCRPYTDTLAWRVFNNAGAGGNQNLSQQFLDIIGQRASVFVKKPTTWDATLGFNDGTDGDADAVSPDWDQEADLEEGDLTDFDATSGTGLSASGAAALRGSFGLAVAITDTTVRYAELSGPTSETFVAAETRFDLNGITMATNDRFAFLQSANADLAIEMQYTGSAYQLRGNIRTDGASFSPTGWTTIADEPHELRIVWKASSGPGNDDGYVRFYIDGKAAGSQTGIDNDTRTVDEVRFGATSGVDAGTSGTIYLDDMHWSDGPGSPPWVIAAAARDGAYGVAFTIEDTTARYVEDTSPTNATELAPELWVDPSGLSMGDGDEFVVATYIEVGGGVDAARLVLGYDGTDDYHYLYTQTRLDGGTYTDGAQVVILSHHGVRVRMHLLFASEAAADDGRTYLLVNDRQRDVVTGLDNDTLNIDTIRYGAVSGLDATTTGVLKMDTLRYSTEELIEVTEESGVAEFFRKVTVAANPTLVKKGVDADRKPLDQISSLVDLGDQDYNAWIYEALPDREIELLEAAPIQITESS